MTIESTSAPTSTTMTAMITTRVVVDARRCCARERDGCLRDLRGGATDASDTERRGQHDRDGFRFAVGFDDRILLATGQEQREFAGIARQRDERFAVAHDAGTTVARAQLEAGTTHAARRESTGQTEGVPVELLEFGIRRSGSVTTRASQVFVVNPVLVHVRAREKSLAMHPRRAGT